MIRPVTTGAQPNHLIWFGIVFMMTVYVFGGLANETSASNDFPALNARGETSSCQSFFGVFESVPTTSPSRLFRMCRAISAGDVFRSLWICSAIVTRGFYQSFPVGLVIFPSITTPANLTRVLQAIFVSGCSMKFRDRFLVPTGVTLFGGHGDTTSAACLGWLHPTGASFYHEMIGRRH